MVEKLNDGYKCVHCGRIIDRKRKANKHELLCNLYRLNKFIDDIETIDEKNLEIPEFPSKESQQITLDVSKIGKCTCGRVLTSKNQFKDRRNLFECPDCENIIRGEDIK